MVSFPPCKINLGLNIIRKRPDGYHDLETCFYPIPWTDILEVVPADHFQFQSTGNIIPGEGDNLCVRAYRELEKDYNLRPVSIHLHKIIPTGAGLGGGSSDAAHVLRLLNVVCNLQLNHKQLAHYASLLGSDCTFFLQDDPMFGSGRGEILTPMALSLSGKFLVVAKPPVHVSTAEAYGQVRPRRPEVSLRSILESKPIGAWKEWLTNDFEQTILPRYPAIQKLKDALYDQGALYASMSGSGAAVFGIFDREITLVLPDDYVTWSGWM